MIMTGVTGIGLFFKASDLQGPGRRNHPKLVAMDIPYETPSSHQRHVASHTVVYAVKTVNAFVFHFMTLTTETASREFGLETIGRPFTVNFMAVPAHDPGPVMSAPEPVRILLIVGLGTSVGIKDGFQDKGEIKGSSRKMVQGITISPIRGLSPAVTGPADHGGHTGVGNAGGIHDGLGLLLRRSLKMSFPGPMTGLTTHTQFLETGLKNPTFPDQPQTRDVTAHALFLIDRRRPVMVKIPFSSLHQPAYR